MIIEKIDIISYAAQNGVCIELSDGINLIEGSNESGKSSIANFIKFVLYGVGARGVDGHLSERKKAIHYLGSQASGSLTVKIDGKRFRISRNVSVSGTQRESVRTRISVIDLETGKELYDGTEPGELLLGIPEGVFMRSAFLRQGGDGELHGADMSCAISNILFSGDERLSVEKATEKINAARIPLSHKNTGAGRIRELRLEIEKNAKLLSEQSDVNERIIATESEIERKKKTNSEHIEKQRYCEKRLRAYENARMLESIRAFEEAKTEKMAAEMALLEFRAGDHIPTDDEMDELRAFERSLGTLSSSVSENSAQRSRLELEREQLRSSLKLREALERVDGDIVERIEELSDSARRLRLVSVLLFAISAIVGGVSFLLPQLVMAFGAGVICFALAAVVPLVCSVTKNKRAKALLDDAGCKDVDELKGALLTYSRTEHRLDALEKDIAENEEHMAEHSELIRSEQERLREFLSDMDVDPSEYGLDRISEVTDVLLKRMRAAAELEGKEREARAYYEGLLTKVGSADARKIEQELAESGIEDPLNADGEKLARNAAFYREQSALLTESIHEKELALAEMRAKVSSPSKIKELISELSAELEKCERKHAAYVLAEESLRAASEELRRSVAPALAGKAGEYMDVLTDGRYSKLSLDSSFELSFEQGGADRHIDYMSCGTQDMAYMSLRLALADTVSAREPLCVVLDEASAHLDDTRARNLMRLLSKRSSEGVQHILFTCHGREKRLLDSDLIEYKYVNL